MKIKKAPKKKVNKKVKIPKTVQQTIPYLYVYEDNGIIETSKGVFSKSYSLLDINYQIAKEQDQQDMFIKYGNLLDSFDPSVSIQICINNKNIDKKEFQAKVLAKEKFDGLDHLRKEYNQMLIKKMSEGRNNLTRERYLTLSIQADSIDDAELVFARLDNEVMANVKKIGGSSAIALKTEERLEILHDIYNHGQEGFFGIKKYDKNGQMVSDSFDFKNLHRQGVSTKDCIGPASFEFKPDYMKIGNTYARALFLNKIPTILSDAILAELTNMNFNMLTSLNITSIPGDEALKRVRNNLRNINANMVDKQKAAAKAGYDASLTNPQLAQEIEDQNELLQEITQNNQKMYQLTLTIVHFANSLEELNLDTETIRTTARRRICEIKTLNYQQENGLNSTLPLATNKIEIKRTLTTNSLCVFMPFVSQELVQNQGFYYGLNAVSRNLLLLNRKLLGNGNGFVFGTPGSGKSMSAKHEMINVLLNTDDDVIVIDPEGEYYPMAQMLNGHVVRLALGSDVHINPLDISLDYANGDDPISLKSDFMISFCEMASGNDRYGLSAIARTIIDRCCRLVYREYLESVDVDGNSDLSKMPTLVDFQRVLMAQSGEAAKQLALTLELYTQGSQNMFAHQTNVEYDSRFVIYNIKDVGANIKSLALLVVLDNIWNKIIANSKKGKYTWVYIDEIYLLFKTENSANFLRELWKRARKFFGIPTGITQNIADLLENDTARTMISNSAYISMLNQAPLDRVQLAELLNISDNQMSYITNSAPGEGLIYTGNAIAPFINRIDKNSTMYASMTSSPLDVKGKRVYKVENDTKY